MLTIGGSGGDGAATDQGRQASRSLGVLSVLFFIALIATLRMFFPSTHTVFEPPWLLPMLNTVFLAAASWVVAYIALKSYLTGGSLSVLLLGCGVLALGTGGSVAGWLIDYGGPNVNVTVFNLSVLLASIFLAAGMIQRPLEADPTGRGRRSALAYLSVLVIIVLYSLAASEGLTPPFFVQGTGPTMVRQVVVALSILLLGVSSSIMMVRSIRESVVFLRWYSLALALLGLAMVAFLVEPAVGSPVGWAGRSAYCLAAVYFLMAVVSALRDARTQGAALNDSIGDLFRASGIHWRRIVETALNGFWVANTKGRYLEVNDACCRMLGYTRQEMLSMSVADVEATESLDDVLRRIEKLRQTESDHFVSRLRRKDGSIIDVEVNATYIDVQGGQVAVFIQDITDRNRAEQALARARSEAERRAAELESFFSSIADGVMVQNAGGDAILANEAAREILGGGVSSSVRERVEQYQVRKLDGTPMKPEETASGRAMQGETVRELRYRLTTPAGRDKVIAVSSSPVRTADGGILGVTTVFRDVTDRVEFERQKEELFTREHHIAEILQQAILPPEMPTEIPDYRIALKYRPALNEAEIGGDFYDVFDLEDNKVGVLIGDVAGKGLPAALRVASIRYAIRSYAYTDPRPARVMTLANEALCREKDGESHMLTAFFAILDPEVGSMTYTSAGHEPPIISNADGMCEELEVRGLPLGLMRDVTYQQSSRRLDHGDVVVMVTDGITEARNLDCELYGKGRLVEFVDERRGASPDEIATGLLEAATAHAGGQLQDDAALVVFSPQKRKLGRRSQ